MCDRGLRAQTKEVLGAAVSRAEAANGGGGESGSDSGATKSIGPRHLHAALTGERDLLSLSRAFASAGADGGGAAAAAAPSGGAGVSSGVRAAAARGGLGPAASHPEGSADGIVVAPAQGAAAASTSTSVPPGVALRSWRVEFGGLPGDHTAQVSAEFFQAALVAGVRMRYCAPRIDLGLFANWLRRPARYCMALHHHYHTRLVDSCDAAQAVYEQAEITRRLTEIREAQKKERESKAREAFWAERAALRKGEEPLGQDDAPAAPDDVDRSNPFAVTCDGSQLLMLAMASQSRILGNIDAEQLACLTKFAADSAADVKRRYQDARSLRPPVDGSRGWEHGDGSILVYVDRDPEACVADTWSALRGACTPFRASYLDQLDRRLFERLTTALVQGATAIVVSSHAMPAPEELVRRVADVAWRGPGAPQVVLHPETCAEEVVALLARSGPAVAYISQDHVNRAAEALVKGQFAGHVAREVARHRALTSSALSRAPRSAVVDMNLWRQCTAEWRRVAIAHLAAGDTLVVCSSPAASDADSSDASGAGSVQRPGSEASAAAAEP